MYRPRDAEHTVLHQVVALHLEGFLRAAAEAGEGVGLPQFVEREFQEFLMCGAFEGGVARFRCEDCALDHLVPFSCKGRGFCPSCGGRRMTERAAHLVDAVLPWVPVRQWVLTVPYRLRYRLAWDHGLSRAVLGIFARVLLDRYARDARARGIAEGRTGLVTVMQRAGGLNANLHFHTLALDGVFREGPEAALAFHSAPAPSDAEVAETLATVRYRVRRLLVRRGLEPGDDATGLADRLADESPVLAGIVGASVQGRVALGPRAGARVRRRGLDGDLEAVTSRGPRQAHLEGFDLHAYVWVAANDRAGLERLCRYVLRPPFAQERLRLRDDGRIAMELKTAWHDGTRELLFEPLEFLERLAAMTPRPETNLLICHGVVSPHARWRERVVVYGRRVPEPTGSAGSAAPLAPSPGGTGGRPLRAPGPGRPSCTKPSITLSTAPRTPAAGERVRVTHPFHPLFGQELQVVQPHRRGHPDRVFFYDDRGQLRSLPLRWTSAEPDDPFVILAAGRSPLRVAELRELAALVRGLRA